MLDELNSYVQKNEIRTLHNSIHKDKHKMDEKLSVRPGSVKLLEEHIGRIPYGIKHSKILYNSPPKIMEIKPK